MPEDGGCEQRIGNLCWIAARLPQLMQEMPVADSGGAKYSMVDFETARAHAGEEGAPDMDAVRRNTSTAFYEALASDAAYCGEAIAQLERVVDQRLGADGPGFSAARAALEGVIHFIAPFAGGAGAAGDTGQ